MDEQQTADMAVPEQLELRVLSGLHAGAALPLGQEPVQLGSGDDCDVILLDPDILPQHLLLRPTADGWLAEPGAAAPLHDRRGAVVPPATPLPLNEPWRAGRVWLVLCAATLPWQADELPDALPAPAAPPAPAAGRGRLWPLLLASIPLLLVALALACLAKPDQAAPRAPAPVALAPADAETVGNEAARILRERGLQRVVDIVYETGHVTLRGELDEEEMRRLESAVAALHRRFGKTLVVDVKATALSRALPFQVREVVTGVAPHITLADGTRVYEGSTVGGYRLQAILPGKLRFDGKRQLELPW